MSQIDTSTLSWAETNLERQLEWVARYDTRISFIAGICIAMLGVLAGIGSKTQIWLPCVYIPFSVAGLLLLASLICIYFGQYPTTSSPNSSLLFFGSIADLKFAEFQKGFKNLSTEDYLDDLLHQTHVNAGILKKKFLFLKTSLILLLLAVPPWIFVIYEARAVL